MRKAPKKTTATLPMKRFVARRIAAILRERQMTQTEAAYLMEDAPSQVSLVVTGHLRGFSLERLVIMASRLGEDVALTLGPSKRKTGKLVVRSAA